MEMGTRKSKETPGRHQGKGSRRQGIVSKATEHGTGVKMQVPGVVSEVGVRLGKSIPKAELFTLQCAAEPRGTLFTAQISVRTPESSGQRVGGGPRICICNKSPGEARTLVWGRLFENHCLKGTRRETGWHLVKVTESS